MYCSYGDLDNEIVTLSEYVPTGKTAATWINQRIRAAQAEIDGRLGMQYAVPFESPVPEIIWTICLYLSASRIMNPGFVGEVPSDSRVVDTYYKRANDLLEKIESGEITIPGATKATDGATIQSTTTDLSREFTQTTHDEDGNVLATGTLDGV